MAKTHKSSGLTISDLRANCDEIGGMWIWKGRLNSQGTPRMSYRGRETTVGRVAYCLWHGIDIDSLGSDFVWSTTETKDINPQNMLRGTNAEMLSWRGKVGRSKRCPQAIAAITKGARKRSGVKLSPEKAAAIRMSSATLDEIAAEYGIHRSMAGKIRQGKCWRETVIASSIFTLGAVQIGVSA